MLQLERIPVQVDSGAEYRQIGIRSFGNGIFHRDPCAGSELSKLKYFEVHPDRLIVSNIMAWEGAVAVSTQKEKGFVGSARFLSYRPIGEVDLRYLNYFFQSESGKVLVRAVSTGTVTRNQTVSPKNFENAKVSLPDLAEQRRVADKLDAAMGRISAVQSLRSKAAEIKAKLHESLVHAVLESEVDMVRMGDVVKLTRTEFEVLPDENYRAIGMRGFGRGIIHYPPVPGDDLGKLRFYTFPKDALALSNIKAWEGAISVTSAIEAGHVASNRFLFYVPTGDRVNVSYLRYYLLSRQGLAQVSACSPGAADRNRTLGVKRFEGIEFKLPPRKIQDRVATTLDAVNQRVTAAHAEPALASLRPSLLDAAFSGRL
ncbi:MULTISPECIES: restriction endonuclease subunit S [unclassified Streptomyces]|uniref:restriction endonuclease subunit S n=1 Tax=unclassified Streptomyces TaxID=2593676 RepID=UPI00344F7DC9